MHRISIMLDRSPHFLLKFMPKYFQIRDINELKATSYTRTVCQMSVLSQKLERKMPGN